MTFQNEIERSVFDFCRQTFLSLWSYANPRRHGSSKELCDVLVLCDPHIVIFSVKDYRLNTAKPTDVAANRWRKKAIQESVAQIYGAERNITQADTVIQSDGSPGLPLPALSERIVHRVSVSLGSQGILPIPTGDFGKGFVHVFNEESLDLVLRELDTISDFIGYLTAKEALCSNYPKLTVEGGEKNFLAVFIKYYGRFPAEPPPPVIPGNIWDDLINSEYYRNKKKADQVSYAWDQIVEWLSNEALSDRLDGLKDVAVVGSSSSLTDNERVLRFMARESRFERRCLAKIWIDFRELALQRRVRARIAPSTSGVAYLFYNPPPEYNREERVKELSLRCYVARNDVSDCETIVGIGTNVKSAPRGYALDISVLVALEWTDENRRDAERIRQDYGFFEAPEHKEMRVD